METIKLTEVLSRLDKKKGLATDGIIISRDGETYKTQTMDLFQATTSQAGIMGVEDKSYLESLKPWFIGSSKEREFKTTDDFNNFLDGLAFDGLKSGRYLVKVGDVPYFLTFAILNAASQKSVIWLEGSFRFDNNKIVATSTDGVKIVARYYYDNAWQQWKTVYDDLSTQARELGNFDSEESALNALTDVSISGDSKLVHVHCTYANEFMSITMMQNVENDYTRQIIFNHSKIYQRAIYFTDGSRKKISYVEDWAFLFPDRLKWDASSNKYLPSQFGGTFNADYTDAIPLATESNNGLMSIAQAKKIKELEDRIAALEAKHE